MPAPVNNDAFLQLLRKAKVVDEQSLQDCLRQIRAKGAVPGSPGQLAGELIRGGVLSQFQAEQLLQGKWRGFGIGRYRILEQLGSGGMGAVFLGEHAHMHRLVAIKVLPAAVAKNPSAVERFYREARAGAAVDHPNLVRTYDVGQDERFHFMAMEFIDGTSLQEIVKRHGPLSPTRAAHYVRQAAMGLQHAHEAGLVHRDIKPSNLLLDRGGTIKILDLGLARFLHDHNDNLTRKYEETVLGTADYFSPEQAIDSHNVDIRGDIYSLGCTCYFMLTGRAPFEGANMVQKLLCHQQKEPEPIASARSDVPDGLLKVLEKMMAKDMAKRQQTPAELAAELSPLCQQALGPPPDKEMPSFSPVIRRAIQIHAKDANTPRPGPRTPPAAGPPAVQAPASPRPKPAAPTAPLPRMPASGPRSGKMGAAVPPKPKPNTAMPPKPKQEPLSKPKDDAESEEWKAWHPDPKMVYWFGGGAVVIGLVILLIIWIATSGRGKEERGTFVPAPPTTPGETGKSAGLLEGSIAPPSSPVNLSTEGQLDWIQWGTEKPDGVRRKNIAAPLISSYTKLGSGTVKGYTTNSVQFAWTDGAAPVPTVTGTKYAIYIEGAGSGFEITVPADTTAKVLRVYVGTYKATGKFEASLSDNSATPYSNNAPSNKDATTTGVYTVRFKAASAGQKLIVRYTMAETFMGNITFQAASLAP